MPSERVEFTGSSGAGLVARLDRPDGPTRASAVFAHCFTCSKDIAAARRISGRLSALGIAVLRFDFTGLGHSGGEFASTNFSSNVGDLVSAAGWLADQGMAPQLMIGHSLGGAAVLKAAPDIPSLRAVVTIGAPSSPAHVTRSFSGHLDEIRRTGSATVSLAGRPFEITRQFVDDIEEARIEEALARLDRALLVLHAPRDEVVGIDNAAEIFRAARHPKSFVTLDDADHLITRDADAEYVADVISAWSSRYLELAPEPRVASAPEGVVRVSEVSPDGFRQDVTVAGSHQLIADEPADAGGTDLGPSPYQLLSAALGACTSMTVRMYARRKGFALAHVSVDVTHDRRHASDSAEPGATAGKVDHFTRVVRLEGDLDDEETASILAIADKCPVHRTLEARAVISTRLDDGEEGRG